MFYLGGPPGGPGGGGAGAPPPHDRIGVEDRVRPAGGVARRRGAEGLDGVAAGGGIGIVEGGEDRRERERTVGAGEGAERGGADGGFGRGERGMQGAEARHSLGERKARQGVERGDEIRGEIVLAEAAEEAEVVHRKAGAGGGSVSRVRGGLCRGCGSKGAAGWRR